MTTVNWGRDSKPRIYDSWCGGLPQRSKNLPKTLFLDFKHQSFLRSKQIMCPGSHFVLGKQSRFPYSSPGAPKALSQDDPVLQILATCAYTLGKAQDLMDSAGLILSQEEAAVPCRLNGCCWGGWSKAQCVLFRNV